MSSAGFPTGKATRGRPRKERYARLMGGFWRNDKARRLSLEARGLLVTAWSYAADQATDGRVPVELLEGWAKRRFAPLMRELAGFLTVEEGAIDAQAHDWDHVNITREEWERKLEADRLRKQGRGGEDGGNGGDIPRGNPPYIPTGNPATFQGGALDDDEDLLREGTPNPLSPPPKPKRRDPSLPVTNPGVLEVHAAWKLACGYPAHKFRSDYGGDAAIIADAIEAHGLADCLLVAAEAPNDGMVNGKRDEHGAKHDTIRYIFGNSDAFARILRAAHDAAGKARGRRSMTDAVAEQKRL